MASDPSGLHRGALGELELARDRGPTLDVVEPDATQLEHESVVAVSLARRRTKRLLAGVLGVGLVAVGLVVALLATSSPTKAAKAVPRFTLSSLEPAGAGQVTSPYGSPEQPGRPTVLLLFSSWCTPCQREVPTLAHYLAHHSLGHVVFLGIDGDSDAGAAKTFLRNAGAEFVVGRDPNFQTTSPIFNLVGQPDTIFISPKGRVVHFQQGPTSPSQLRRWAAVASVTTS